MDEILQVSVDLKGAHPIVHANGEVDISSAPLLREALDEVAANAVVIVDMSEVSFLDSTGIGVLVTALKRRQSEHDEGMLRLVVTSPHIAKVLDVTGLTAMFAVFPSLQEASA